MTLNYLKRITKESWQLFSVGLLERFRCLSCLSLQLDHHSVADGLHSWNDRCFSDSVTWNHQLPLCYRISGGRGRRCECLCNVYVTWLERCSRCFLELPDPSALPLTILTSGLCFFHLCFAILFSLPPQTGLNSLSISFLSGPQACTLNISILVALFVRPPHAQALSVSLNWNIM